MQLARDIIGKPPVRLDRPAQWQSAHRCDLRHGSANHRQRMRVAVRVDMCDANTGALQRGELCFAFRRHLSVADRTA